MSAQESIKFYNLLNIPDIQDRLAVGNNSKADIGVTVASLPNQNGGGLAKFILVFKAMPEAVSENESKVQLGGYNGCIENPPVAKGFANLKDFITNADEFLAITIASDGSYDDINIKMANSYVKQAVARAGKLNKAQDGTGSYPYNIFLVTQGRLLDDPQSHLKAIEVLTNGAKTFFADKPQKP